MARTALGRRAGAVTLTRTGTAIRLPRADGTVELHEMGAPAALERPQGRLTSRAALAAVHVVADPLAANVPGGPAHVDWEATLAFRRHVWSWGLGVAEAMDTAQRGMGLDWAAASELIRRSVREARSVGGRIVCGAGTDQLAAGSASGLDDVVSAYLEQASLIEREGGEVVIMASRELARIASGPEAYAEVYRRVLGQLERPAILHWLGEAFDPALKGYWGFADLDRASDACLEVMRDSGRRVDGVKVSLLDADREVAMRRRLPPGVRMYTGDDFDFPTLIEGDADGHSDALLGIFDAITPAASAALQALDAGDRARFREILAPTVPLSRLIFARPTYFYKTGIVFLAYLNGHQPHFRMIGAQEGMRSPVHLAGVFALADRAGLLDDPELACHRMRGVLALAGFE